MLLGWLKNDAKLRGCVKGIDSGIELEQTGIRERHLHMVCSGVQNFVHGLGTPEFDTILQRQTKKSWKAS